MSNLNTAIDNGLAPPEPLDLRASLEWLDARYFRNSRDDAFVSWFGEIVQPGPDGKPIPVAIRDPLTEEASGLAIIGASEEGKSALVRRNLGALPSFKKMIAGSEGNYLQVIMDPEGTIKSLARELLKETGYGRVAVGAKSHELWSTLRHRLKMLGIQMIWIDETHHLLRAGTGRDAVQARQMLKSLMQGSGAVALLLSGVPELDSQLLADPETDRRILRLRLDQSFGARPEDAERIARFTSACCNNLGLTAPIDPTFYDRIVFAGFGSLGASLKLLKGSIRRALIDGRGALELAHARRSYEIRHGRQNVGPFDEGQWAVIREILEMEGRA